MLRDECERTTAKVKKNVQSFRVCPREDDLPDLCCLGTLQENVTMAFCCIVYTIVILLKGKTHARSHARREC